MDLDIIAAIAILAAALLGPVFLPDFLEHGMFDLIRWLLGERKPRQQTYSERLADITRRLMKSSSEVDGLLDEMARITKGREHELQRIERQLSQFQEEERSLEERIDALRDTPLPAAEHFARMIERGERRSAWRDYILFAVGVVVTTVIAIVLRLIGLS